MYSAAAAWLMTNLRCRPSDRINGSGRCQSAHVLVCTTGRRVSRYRQQATFHLSSRDIGYDRIGLVRDAIIRRPSECMDVVLFVFLVNALWALEGPAWQSLVPELVPKEDLSAAIAANSVGINISRAIGPALAGVLITGIGIVAPFWLYAFSNAGLILVFLWWRTSQPPGRPLPTERFTGALRGSLRYVRNNRYLRATLARSVGFFLCASAYWALLPLVSRVQIGGGPEVYGLLLGAIGAGAVGCAFVLPYLRSKLGANGLVGTGEAGTALSLLLFGFAREPATAVLASIVAGMSWIAVLASLNVSVQVALPDWIRGRGLAMYQTVFFGTNDNWERFVGRTCRCHGAIDCEFCRSRRRAFGNSPNMAVEAANWSWGGSHTLDALAGADCQQSNRKRCRACDGDSRVSRRTEGPGGVSYRYGRSLARTQT